MRRRPAVSQLCTCLFVGTLPPSVTAISARNNSSPARESANASAWFRIRKTQAPMARIATLPSTGHDPRGDAIAALLHLGEELESRSAGRQGDPAVLIYAGLPFCSRDRTASICATLNRFNPTILACARNKGGTTMRASSLLAASTTSQAQW